LDQPSVSILADGDPGCRYFWHRLLCAPTDENLGRTQIVTKDRFTIALVLAGVGILAYAIFSPRGEHPSSGKSESRIQSENNPDKILPEILRKFDQRIQIKHGFVFITDEPGVDTYLLPLTSPWLVQCGIGASIQLGAVANGSDGAVGSQVDVQLFDQVIDKAACAVIAPEIARRLQERLAGR
jgi:hypothetical protein